MRAGPERDGRGGSRRGSPRHRRPLRELADRDPVARARRCGSARTPRPARSPSRSASTPFACSITIRDSSACSSCRLRSCSGSTSSRSRISLAAQPRSSSSWEPLRRMVTCPSCAAAAIAAGQGVLDAEVVVEPRSRRPSSETPDARREQHELPVVRRPAAAGPRAARRRRSGRASARRRTSTTTRRAPGAERVLELAVERGRGLEPAARRAREHQRVVHARLVLDGRSR